MSDNIPHTTIGFVPMPGGGAFKVVDTDRRVIGFMLLWYGGWEFQPRPVQGIFLTANDLQQILNFMGEQHD